MLDSALGWIGQIVGWVGQFIPRWVIIDTTEAGVKWVRGSRVVSLGPGIHWWWPVVTKIATHPVVRQTVDLRPQTLETKDEQTILAGGLITYEIDDIEKALSATYQPDQTIKDITLSAIHDVLCDASWEEIRTAPRLMLRLKNEVQRELAPFGVRVLKMKLTDLARCPVVRLIQSTNTDGI